MTPWGYLQAGRSSCIGTFSSAVEAARARRDYMSAASSTSSASDSSDNEDGILMDEDEKEEFINIVESSDFPYQQQET